MAAKQKQPAGTDEVTTTVSFDRATYKKLKLLAVERETNVRDLIREAVDELLRKKR